MLPSFLTLPSIFRGTRIHSGLGPALTSPWGVGPQQSGVGWGVQNHHTDLVWWAVARTSILAYSDFQVCSGIKLKSQEKGVDGKSNLRERTSEAEVIRMAEESRKMEGEHQKEGLWDSPTRDKENTWASKGFVPAKQAGHVSWLKCLKPPPSTESRPWPSLLGIFFVGESGGSSSPPWHTTNHFLNSKLISGKSE